jgi:hypothetical protein
MPPGRCVSVTLKRSSTTSGRVYVAQSDSSVTRLKSSDHVPRLIAAASQ